VALLGQERSPQPPGQKTQFRLRPAANCRHQDLQKKTYLRLERGASTSTAWSVERDVSLGLVVYVQKSDFHLIHVFCVVIFVKKCTILWLVHEVFSYFVLFRSKIPLLISTKFTRVGSLLFWQQG